MVRKLVYIIWEEGKYWPDRVLFKTKKRAMEYLEVRVEGKDFEKEEVDYDRVTYTVYHDRGRIQELIKKIDGEDYHCRSIRPLGQKVSIYKILCQKWVFEEDL